MDTELGSILDALGPARRFADPDSPLDGRLIAARGALPLPPHQLATVLYALTLDPEPEVKQRASESLQGLQERILDTALDADLHPAVLAFFAEHLRGDSARMEKLALNSATSDSTLCFLAGLPHLRVIEIVSNNQVRLLRCPGLFEALGENPLTSQSIIDRILEFLGLKREPAAGAEPDPQVGAQSEAAEAAAADPSWNDPSELPEELVSEKPEGEEEEERSRNLAGLLHGMSVIDKIKLARFGNQEARGLLVRDRNRIVASAAIRSPKLTENEILMFAKSRNLSDEVLRVIANTREWTKNYQVQLALATNPKAPLVAAIKFLNYLTDRDLKSIMRSRDVPTPITQHARRILSRKGRI